MLNFRKGEVFYIDTPYATVVKGNRLGDTCNWCFKRICPDTIKCSSCSRVIYCSTTCQAKDTAFHVFECFSLKKFLDAEKDMERFILRTLARVLKEKESDSPTTSFFFEHPRTFHDLLSHADKFDEVRLEHYRKMCEGIALLLSENGHEVSPELILEIPLKLRINAHSVTDNNYIFNEVCVGNALYLGASKSDHSCFFASDYLLIFSGNRYVWKALRDFSVSSCLELRSSYICPRSSFFKRQKMLKERYYFTCECSRCVSESRDTEALRAGILETLMFDVPNHLSRGLRPLLEAKMDQLSDSSKGNLLTRMLFAKDSRKDLNHFLPLASAVLGGCLSIYERMKILFMVCLTLAGSNANHPSNGYNREFEKYLEMALTLFTEVHGEGHRLVEKLASLKLSKATESPSLPATAEQDGTRSLEA